MQPGDSFGTLGEAIGFIPDWKSVPPGANVAILYLWAERCQPPFSTSEVDKCVNSVFRYPQRGPRKVKGVIL